MDNPGDAFQTFLNPDSVIYLAVNGTVFLLLSWNDIRVSE